MAGRALTHFQYYLRGDLSLDGSKPDEEGPLGGCSSSRSIPLEAVRDPRFTPSPNQPYDDVWRKNHPPTGPKHDGMVTRTPTIHTLNSPSIKDQYSPSAQLDCPLSSGRSRGLRHVRSMRFPRFGDAAGDSH